MEACRNFPIIDCSSLFDMDSADFHLFTKLSNLSLFLAEKLIVHCTVFMTIPRNSTSWAICILSGAIGTFSCLASARNTFMFSLASSYDAAAPMKSSM